jgi:flagellar hook-length control protein FliK
LLTLAKTPEGAQQMTVRLQPGDLGMVQVKIERTLSGTTQIDITADNPATLLAMQRDQPQLHRTLDEAGIPAAGRTVTFHTAQAAQATQAAANSNSGSPAGHNANQQNTPSRTNTSTTDADGSATGGRGSYLARERNTYPTGRRPAAPPPPAGAKAATQSYRVGLDITA